KRRVTGAHGMILVSEWRAKKRHDAVAHDLVDCALVAVHGVHHPFQDGVEKLTRFFRITVREQLHRSLEVGEKDRDLLTLTLQGSSRVQNTFGEVLWRVGLG